MPSQSKLAAQQLAKKLKLEEQVKPDLRRLFKKIAKDINVIWVATNNIPSLESFKPELITLLRDHYRRVEKKFSKTLRMDGKGYELLLEKKQDNQEETDNSISHAIMAYILTHSVLQSQYILDTTQKELQSIVAHQAMQSAMAEIPQSSIEMGNAIKSEFEAASTNRIDTIALTETQMAAETMKHIEAGILALALLTQSEQLISTWHATLDSRTRPAHAYAHGQEVPQGIPFHVGGEQLLYPGDSSLGASLGNIINCRCSSITTVKSLL